MVETMLAKPLCLHLAREQLREARMILETFGSKPNKDVTNLIDLRKKLELSFDYYLDNRTSQTRQTFANIVKQIQHLRSSS